MHMRPCRICLFLSIYFLPFPAFLLFGLFFPLLPPVFILREAAHNLFTLKTTIQRLAARIRFERRFASATFAALRGRMVLRSIPDSARLMNEITRRWTGGLKPKEEYHAHVVRHRSLATIAPMNRRLSIDCVPFPSRHYDNYLSDFITGPLQCEPIDSAFPRGGTACSVEESLSATGSMRVHICAKLIAHCMCVCVYTCARTRAYARAYVRNMQLQTEQSHVKLVAIGVLQTRGASHLGADHGDTHGRGRRRGQQARLHPCKWCTARTVLPKESFIVYLPTKMHLRKRHVGIRTHRIMHAHASPCTNETCLPHPPPRSFERASMLSMWNRIA